MGDLSAHFDSSEFRCKCAKCQKSKAPVCVTDELIDCLETLREFADAPIIITSGNRCPEHNTAVGGEPDSEHLTGEAADIFVAGSLDRFVLLEGVFHYGPRRVGIGKDFLHIGVSKKKPQGVAWGYWD